MRSHGNRKIRKKATENRKNQYIPAESRKATPSYRPSLNCRIFRKWNNLEISGFNTYTIYCDH